MIEDQQCGICVSFLVDPKNKKQGQCRGTFPQVVVTTQNQPLPQMAGGRIINAGVRQVSALRSVFPPMLAEDPGCSKFKTKE